jgi:hypothetical protein
MEKSQIKKDVYDCLSKSDKKMSIFDISKATGYKTDNVYVIVVDIKDIKFKKIGDIIHWYLNEDQIDPPIKIIDKKSKKSIDPVFLKIYENDKKNSPNNRRIFLSPEEHQDYRDIHEPKKEENLKQKMLKGIKRKR